MKTITYNNITFKIVKKWTKLYLKYNASVNKATGKSLNEVYKKPSSLKSNAWNRCINKLLEFDDFSSDFGILSYNSFSFTFYCNWVDAEEFDHIYTLVITKDNNYLLEI